MKLSRILKLGVVGFAISGNSILFTNCSNTGFSPVNSSTNSLSSQSPVLVAPVNAPSIKSLKASSMSVSPNSSVVISWVLSGDAPTSIKLNNIDVTGRSSLNVTLSVTGTFTLIATNQSGFDTSSLTVQVIPPPTPTPGTSPTPMPTATPSPTPSPSPVCAFKSLTGLPSDGAASATMTASLSTTLSCTLYCRLNRISDGIAYTPIVCPNPFMVGITSPLTPGNYEVDFYLDKGAGIDASKPDQFRAWTIAAPPPTPTPTTSPTPPPVTGVTPLPPAYLGSSAWGVDAPDDNDQAAWVNSGFTAGGSDGSRGYSEKGYAYVLNNLSQLPTISNSANGGGTRFGPVTVDGLPAILHNVRQGDALRYQGNRSGIVYGGYAIQHGEDHWFAWAFKLGTEWQVANSGGHGDRNGLFDTHQQTATIGNPSGLNWWGDSPAGHELWWYVERMDGSGSAFLYNAPAAPGQWQRCIIHYRSGSLAQGPVYDVWFATGTAAYVKLPRAIDPYTGTQWTTVPAFGDITNNLTGQVDYPKLEFYKWTHDIYGNMPNRNYWTSGLFAAPGLDNYDAAVAALAPYAK